MLDEWKGKRVLISGASRGIGAAVAKQLGTAEECVGAYVFLGTDSLSGYVTGQIIEVNGGQRRR